MTIGIYCIENKLNGKKYIGKSKNIEGRISNHRYCLKKNKHHNPPLQSSYNKYGKDSFGFYVLEVMDDYDPIELSFRELWWIDEKKTLDRQYGYNLLYDEQGAYTLHPDTIKIMKENRLGENNPNYGNKWDDEQKEVMRQIAIDRHSSGMYYTDAWRQRISQASIRTWQDEEIKKRMAENVSKAKSQSDFLQYRKDGTFVAAWRDIHQIIRANPGWKWQNIYAACNGSKRSYQGYLWKREPKKPWRFYTTSGMDLDEEDCEWPLDKTHPID